MSADTRRSVVLSEACGLALRIRNAQSKYPYTLISLPPSKGTSPPTSPARVERTPSSAAFDLDLDLNREGHEFHSCHIGAPARNAASAAEVRPRLTHCHLERSMPKREANRHVQSKDPCILITPQESQGVLPVSPGRMYHWRLPNPFTQAGTLANPEHLAKLNEGVESWNEWRKQNREVQPDLHGVVIRGCLRQVDLFMANLQNSDLDAADMQGADLTRANLIRATLAGANFSGAKLGWANLHQAVLKNANLSQAILGAAELFGADS